MGPARKLAMNQDFGKRFTSGLDLVLQFMLISGGLVPAIWLVRTCSVSADARWKLVLVILGAILIFVYGYYLTLLGFRLVVPYTPEGYFPRRAGGEPPMEGVIFLINVFLIKAKHQPPWAKMFGAVIINTFPLRQLYRRFYGPHGRGVLPDNSVVMTAPYLVYVGDNVEFGEESIIVCSHLDQRGFFVRRVVIEDDVTVGGGAVIGPGVTIGKGAMIGAASFVRPNTRVGPYEYWAGDPARRIKRIKPPRGDGGSYRRKSSSAEELQVR